MNWRKRVQKLLLLQGLSWQIVAKIDRWFVVVLLIRMFTQVAQIVTANNNCWFITCQQSGDSPGQCDHPFLTLVSVTLLCVKQPLTSDHPNPIVSTCCLTIHRNLQCQTNSTDLIWPTSPGVMNRNPQIIKQASATTSAVSDGYPIPDPIMFSNTRTQPKIFSE